MEVLREQIYRKVPPSSVIPSKNNELVATSVTFKLCNRGAMASMVKFFHPKDMT